MITTQSGRSRYARIAAMLNARPALSPWLVSTVGVLAAANYIFVYISPIDGVFLVLAVLLGIYVTLSVFPKDKNRTEVVEDISLLFIYILLEAALPCFFLSQNLLIPGVYTIVIGLAFWRVYSKNGSLHELGFVKTKVVRYSIIGLLIGVPAGIIEYFVLRPAPSVPAFSYAFLLQTIGVMLFFVALGEEVLFRALIQRSLVKMAGAKPGIVWAALIFSIMHTGWRSPIELAFTFLAGLLLGTFYYKTKSLAGPIAIHAVDNVVLTAIMPFLVG